ncbi:TetR/AcrR family transcriptional regulator [Streptomyces sp. NPDC088354]|uniref:TetR/AcrR family transcriptional regulator n=1 Tax=unclassified Streptomyces TaxID=2593676 RepID=UPI0029BD5E4B|nr:TetR family transcriptional regulator [Streptomyces sp. MI02-7b]MDX3072900.1 TetR family transcriptional regulator [Streptomyces sp. MI02-7b]
MSTTGASPVRRRRGRGARERILKAATELFTAQGINATGMEQLTAAAEVSKRTLYQHFSGKDELVHAFLREMEDALLPPRVPPEMTAQDARAQLLAVFSWPPPDPSAPLRGCPFLNAAVEVPDPDHPVHRLAATYKTEFARRLAGLAGRAGARDPETLGEQLALLYDGAVARGTALNTVGSGAVARSIAASLLDAALTPEKQSAR